MTAQTLRLGDLKRKTEFDLKPNATERDAIAKRLGITGVKKLTFTGSLSPLGKSDWELHARLGATVVQPCVVTLDPVTTRIDEDTSRRYLADMPEAPDAAEFEMPEDDTAEALPETLDLAAVMEEALALALPAWPRAPGIEPVEIAVTEPGQTPMTDDDAKPFAALKSLQQKLNNDDPDSA
ncbi:YceD family protein [Boseongicola aestuarii]|uniref:DUF177 domain-containing protein n=1 Tax=Boseongicola aestuarii TaxID=1470561 RepID=A0A238IWA2_9RHOB|nr:DUF177 domain-containing protein [Boseongicola aestuarii]SMX22313.1 hypothetical protein BOA8489_00404 [Boseongicola aestuarii]